MVVKKKIDLCISFLICFGQMFYAQNVIYNSSFPVELSAESIFKGSLLNCENKIIYSTNNFSMYAVDKENLTVAWTGDIGWRSDNSPSLYKNTFLQSSYDGYFTRVLQYDLASGNVLKTLDLHTLHSIPYFIGSMMYVTALTDGGKLLAYDLEKNKIIWSKNIGDGVDFQPIYLKDKIIAKTHDDYWIDVDYNGKFLSQKSNDYTYIDDEKVSARKGEFFTHDEKEVRKEFLKKNKLANTDFKIQLTNNNTFLLSERFLTVIGGNLKIKLQLDLETIVPAEEYENDALSTILSIQDDKIWFLHQNHLIHYDFRKESLLRNVYLNNWRPHHIVLDQRTIWLISKNDGQLYKLDFEPNEKLDREINKQKAIQERLRCDLPNPEKAKAMKAAAEKFRQNQK